MPMRRKTPRHDLRLKLAIVESGYTQRRLAQLARMGEIKLSHIVNGREQPTDAERKAIARILNRPADDLFPPVTA